MNLSQEVISRQEAEMLRERMVDLEKDNQEYKKMSESAMDLIRKETQTLKMDNEFLIMKVKELEKENEELERTEDALLTQTKIQKQEIDDLRRTLKNSNGDSVRQHIKSSLLNWLDSMAKSKREEAITICNLMMSQLELKANEKTEFFNSLDKLKIKKKTA